jgi:hypothetical protein
MVVAALTLAGTAAAQTPFLEGAPDVPLPQGAVALTASAVEPETAGGQHLLYLVSAEGPAEAALGFYAETLPQLGWAPAERQDEALTYARGRDLLLVRPFAEGAADGRVTLLVEVISSPASQALD